MKKWFQNLKREQFIPCASETKTAARLVERNVCVVQAAKHQTALQK